MILKQLPLLLFVVGLSLQSNAQCPACTPVSPPLPGMPADTLYINELPDGMQGEYYEESIIFRFPETLQPICDLDPTLVPPEFCGLAMDAMRIISVVGLPQGMDYLPNLSEYALPADKDGCATICGTPLFPGLYTATINLEVNVIGTWQPASFDQSLNILPAVSNTVGFSASPATGCEGLTVEFTNNIPSNGNAGITYSWDLGNGTNSTVETLPSQTYNMPGEYIVNYEAVIDTLPRELAIVTISASDCNDDVTPLIPLPPDFYIRIFDPNGVEIYNTESSTVDDQYPPVQINISPAIDLVSGNYSVEVWDSDGVLNADDDCGNVNFTDETMGALSSGALTVDLTINDYTETITSTDTIEVYPTPATPVVSSAGGTTIICPGDVVTLSSSTMSDNYQWYFIADGVADTTAISGATDPTYDATEWGGYYVVVTSDNNCSAVSAPLFFDCPIGTDDLPELQSSLEVYPNPNSGTFTLAFELTQNSDVRLSVVDILGQQVYENTLSDFSGFYKENISLERANAGMYIMQIQVGKHVSYKKFLVN